MNGYISREELQDLLDLLDDIDGFVLTRPAGDADADFLYAKLYKVKQPFVKAVESGHKWWAPWKNRC